VAKMTEKISRRSFGSMEIEVTVDDPKNSTKPFTVTLNETLEADTELADEVCAEGEKDYERLQRSRAKKGGTARMGGMGGNKKGKEQRAKGIRVIGVVIAAIIVVSAPGLAQWLKYPTDGIPRKADGTPDLTARAPRLPDG